MSRENVPLVKAAFAFTMRGALIARWQMLASEAHGLEAVALGE
jgi:hypothetical protein